MKYKNQKGFTLLEIIIVIIIIGVLASLALPRFLDTVEASRGGEALQSISAVRGALSRCYLRKSAYTDCAAFGNLDIQDPASSPGAHFNYNLSGSASAYSVRATRNATSGGNTADYIQLVETSSTIAKTGTGAFKNVN